MRAQLCLVVVGLGLIASSVYAGDAVMLKKTTYVYKTIGDTKIEADVYRSASPKASTGGAGWLSTSGTPSVAANQRILRQLSLVTGNLSLAADFKA